MRAIRRHALSVGIARSLAMSAWGLAALEQQRGDRASSVPDAPVVQHDQVQACGQGDEVACSEHVSFFATNSLSDAVRPGRTDSDTPA